MAGMASAQGIELHELRGQTSIGERVSPLSTTDGIIVARTGLQETTNIQEEEWQPSRRYQTILLAAGFMMIFHVIGINSIYGIFQV